MGKITRFLIASETNNYEPGVLSYKAFTLYGVVLMLLRIFMGPMPAMSAGVDSGRLMGLINVERENRNLNTLYTNDKLITAAGQKAQDMIDRDYFAHVDPDGNYIWGKIVAAGYTPYRILGENLAVNFDTSEGMIAAWLNSPKHRDNLLNAEFVDQGLSARYGDYQGNYTDLTASLFGTLAAAPTNDSGVKAAVSAEQTAPAPAKVVTPSPAKAIASTITPPPQNSNVSEPASPIESVFIHEAPTPTKHRPSTRIPDLTRSVFTTIGLLLLIILTVDAVIIHKHNLVLGRSHSTHHLLSFFFLVIVSIAIWWW